MSGSIGAVQLARVMPGASSFRENNVNDTYRGQILVGNSIVTAVIKDLTAKELANELAAAVLARAVDLPVPTPYLALVDASDLPLDKAPVTNDGARLVFASTDVGVPNVYIRYHRAPREGAYLLGGITAWPQLGRLYGFDAWTANIDRHAGNLLFVPGGEAWLIDHGHCFTGAAWSASSLDAGKEYPHRLVEWVTDHLTTAGRDMQSKRAAALESELRSLDLEEVMVASHADKLLSADDLRALVWFLTERIGKTTFYANKALKVDTLV